MQPAVVEDLKIFASQVVHSVALLVTDDNLQQNSVDVGLNREGCFFWFFRLLSSGVSTQEKRHAPHRKSDSTLGA